MQQQTRRRLSTASGKRHECEEDDVVSRLAPLAPSPSWRDSVRLAYASKAVGPTYRTYSERCLGFDLPRLVLLLLVLMAAITVPALSWYCAVPMTSMADITALYNTFSVWALVFSVWFLGDRWSRYKVASVLLACGGVVVVAYGGADHRQEPKELNPLFGKRPASSSAAQMTSSTTGTGTTPAMSPTSHVLRIAELVVRALVDVGARAVDLVVTRYQDRAKEGDGSASNPLLGDLLALFGAVTMAAYEMAFKLLGTLPDEQEQRRCFNAVQSSTSRRHDRLSTSSQLQRGSSGHSAVWRDAEDEESRGLLTTELQEGKQAPYHAIEEAESSSGVAGDASRGEPSVWRHSSSLPIPDANGHLLQLQGERSAIFDGERASGYGSNRQASPSHVSGGPIRSSPSRNYEPEASVISYSIAAATAAENGHMDDSSELKDDERKLLVTARSLTASSSSSSSVGDIIEQESTLDDGDAEEIRDGSTRLRRPKSSICAQSARRNLRHYVDYRDDEADNDHLNYEDPSEAVPDALNARAHRNWVPPPLPFGLHTNIMTAGIGVVTLCTLWIGVLIAHLAGWERFEWPNNWVTVFAILFVVLAGVVFNGCFMVLLATWGPVTASVSCLLSTVAVAILDAALGAPFSLASALGCVFILGGFALLLLESAEGHGH